MGEIVNLRRVKKRRAAEQAEQAAREQRRLHGRTKAERVREADEAKRRETVLDGARVKTAPPGLPGPQEA